MTIELSKLYSQTARAVRPSAIREMAKHAAQPGAISFTRGDPAPEIFPVEEFYECARVLRACKTQAEPLGAFTRGLAFRGVE